MESATPRRRNWQMATAAGFVEETETVRTIEIDFPGWPGHVAGQCVDVRLGGGHAYRGQRRYSIASAPEDHRLVLTVMRSPDDEVSSYLVDDLGIGDRIALRGPVGQYFTWDGRSDAPLLLFAGGIGVVPFRSMLRHRAALKSRVPVRLLYSARELDDVIYREELARCAAFDEIDVRFTLTRAAPPHWQGYQRRIDRDLVAEVAWPPDENPSVFISGPSGFVATAAQTLIDLGYDTQRIKAEPFGSRGPDR
jgi:ferredoxin-NADP reductase